MKILVLGDTHSRDTFKTLVSDEYDLIVFMGDYFDTYDKIPPIKWMENFKDIIEYKKSREGVVCLIGNHDWMQYSPYGQTCSGYNAGAAAAIWMLLEPNMEHLQMCFRYENLLFTHAGVSRVWAKNHGIDTSPENIEQSINDRFKYKPDSFRFKGVNPYGDDPTQSPIWIRENSLANTNIEGFTQIVGHTYGADIRVNTLVPQKPIIMVDCLPRECLVIEDGEYYTLDIPTRELISLKV
jgi:hypothetical protein